MAKMEPCPNTDRNLERCPCDYEPCERRGLCCECVAYHKAKDQLPACLRHLGKD